MAYRIRSPHRYLYDADEAILFIELYEGAQPSCLWYIFVRPTKGREVGDT